MRRSAAQSSSQNNNNTAKSNDSRNRSSSPSKPGKLRSSTGVSIWVLLLVVNAVLLGVIVHQQRKNILQETASSHCASDQSNPERSLSPSFASLNDFHIIFSTGCSPKQDWQSYVLFHSILESGQTGHATRIASGCTPEQAAQLQQTFDAQIRQPMGNHNNNNNNADRFHLHLTPEFGEGFHYLNKPYGVAHWMEEVLGYSSSTQQQQQNQYDDTIIVLLDPDMIVSRPFVNDFTQGEEVWRKRTTYPHRIRVNHGFPMAQQYGYGMAWFDGVKNIADVIPPAELPSPVQKMTRPQLVENYTAGPPYLATGRDFYRLASKWRQLSKPTLQLFPDTILAEMYAYSWAAAHLNMPHQMAHSFMVSNFFEPGFELFNRNQYTPVEMCRGIPRASKPHVLHYCQRYSLGKYILGKHRMPVAFVGQADPAPVCASPLLVEPPDNVAALFDYYIEPDSHKRYNMTAGSGFTKEDRIGRTAYFLCEESGAFNRAALFYKKQHCDAKTANTAKTLIFHDSLEPTAKELSTYG